jgi:hypothetical protein
MLVMAFHERFIKVIGFRKMRASFFERIASNFESSQLG